MDSSSAVFQELENIVGAYNGSNKGKGSVYEQGYLGAAPKRVVTNRYFVGGRSSAPCKPGHAPSSSHVSIKPPDNLKIKPRPSPCTSLVQMLATVIEGHHFVDVHEYRNKLALLATDDHAREVNKNYRVLKEAYQAALERPIYEAPAHPDVALLVARLLGRGVVFVNTTKCTYVMADGASSNYVMFAPWGVEQYSSASLVYSKMSERHIVPQRPFKHLRIAELRAYASEVLPETNVSAMKRELLCRALQDRIEHGKTV
jgi:hypothetical protein